MHTCVSAAIKHVQVHSARTHPATAAAKAEIRRTFLEVFRQIASEKGPVFLAAAADCVLQLHECVHLLFVCVCVWMPSGAD